MGAQLEFIKLIETEEQQTTMTIQLQISQPIWQTLQWSEQNTEETFLLQAMFTQEEEVQHADASSNEPRSYQKAMNSSEQSL